MMNKLPVITIFFWTAFLFGSWLMPEIFRQDAVQLPAVFVLSVLLPVSFWQVKEKKLPALLFVGILFVNAALLSVAAQGNYDAQQKAADALNKAMQPIYAEYVETGASVSKRKLAAQFFYQRHRIALPYKTEADSYTLYSPSQDDKDKYRENFHAVNKLKIRIVEFATSIQTAVFLLFIHVGLFIGLLVFLLLYDKKKEAGA
jgi:hypothetical protein